MNAPTNLLYTKEHEWMKIEGKKATIGISEYAQGHLGDITFIELPKIGQKVLQFKPCATVESVKAASDIYAPLSGTISQINTTLNASPELINKSPYEKGWIAVIDIENEGEKKNLLQPAAYDDYVKQLH